MVLMLPMYTADHSVVSGSNFMLRSLVFRDVFTVAQKTRLTGLKLGVS